MPAPDDLVEFTSLSLSLFLSRNANDFVEHEEPRVAFGGPKEFAPAWLVELAVVVMRAASQDEELMLRFPAIITKISANRDLKLAIMASARVGVSGFEVIQMIKEWQDG